MPELVSSEPLVVKIIPEAYTAGSLIAIVFLWNIKPTLQFSQNVSTKQSATLMHSWHTLEISKLVVYLGCLS